MSVHTESPLTAAKLQRTGMSIHGEVFKVHGTFCSHREPGNIHTDVRHERRKTSTEQRQEYVDTGGKKQLNQILLRAQIRKHVQISPDTVQSRIIFPSLTRNALRAPSCRCLFLDSLVKNSMLGHPWRTNLPSISHLAHLWQQYGLRLYLPSPIASKHTKVNVLRSPLQTPRVSASWFCCQKAFIYLLVCWRLLKCHQLFYTPLIAGYINCPPASNCQLPSPMW